jgi:hypothetical protein
MEHPIEWALSLGRGPVAESNLSLVDVGTQFASTAGSKVKVAASTATTASMIPKAIDRKAGLGTMRMAAREASTVKALKATALPAVSTVSATEATMASWSPGSAPRRSRAERNRMTRKRA